MIKEIQHAEESEVAADGILTMMEARARGCYDYAKSLGEIDKQIAEVVAFRKTKYANYNRATMVINTLLEVRESMS